MGGKVKLEPDIISYGSSISACEKGGQWPEALSLLREKGGRWLEALSLLREMGDVRLALDVITYNAGISACEKGGQWPEVLSLLRELEDVGEHYQAQCWHQRVRERRTVAGGAVAARELGERDTDSERYQKRK